MRNTKTIFLKRACDSKAFAAACESAGKNCGDWKKQLLGAMYRLRDEVEEGEEEGEADNDKAKGKSSVKHECSSRKKELQ